MVEDALRRRIDVDIVSDEFAVDLGIERRADDAWMTLVQSAHGVEAVRDVRDAVLLYDFERRLVVGARMADRNEDARIAAAIDERILAVQLLGRQGHDAHDIFKGFNPAVVSAHDSLLRLRSLVRLADERAFHVHAEDARALGRHAHGAARALEGGVHRVLARRHRRREPRDDARAREVASDGGESLFRRVHHVPAARAVHMHVDEARRDEQPMSIMHLVDARFRLHLIHVDDPLDALVVEKRHIFHDAEISLHVRQQEPSIDDRLHLTFPASPVSRFCALSCASLRRCRK